MEVEDLAADVIEPHSGVGQVTGPVGFNGLVRQEVIDPGLQGPCVAFALEGCDQLFQLAFMGCEVVEQYPGAFFLVLAGAVGQAGGHVMVQGPGPVNQVFEGLEFHDCYSLVQSG